ncbi:MAG: DUF362 domain-containing protein [Candidatus Kariarchaeaceae archaeon]|jgi:uncharacterized protein (DUF362 family)
MSEVFLVKTNDRTQGMTAIFAHYKTLFRSLNGKSVVIKPNFNTADPPPASTDITMIRDLILELQNQSVSRITIAERSGPANTEETMHTKGLFNLENELDFDIIDFSKMPTKDWIHLKPEKSHWRNGFLFAKPLLDAQAVINLACLKTHQYGGHFTMSLKLAVGNLPRDGYDYMRELHSSPRIRSMIAEINQVFTPVLSIIDGVDAFSSGGPATGELVSPNVMIASSDRIALDAVGVAILRDLGTTPEVSEGPIFELEQIKRAAELGIGVSKPEDIEIIGLKEPCREYADHLKKILVE